MQKVLTTEEMQELDLLAVKNYSIPSSILMENAALSFVNILIGKIDHIENKNVFIFCGKGNNGGDGFAIGRHLFNRNANVFIFLIGSRADLKGDALLNANIIQKIKNNSSSKIRLEYFELRSLKFFQDLPEPDIIIDAIFGTGVKGNIEGLAKNLIEYINAKKIPVFAVDIPSGINGSTGEIGTIAIDANYTITMGALKSGLLINEGPKHCGEIHIADISMPESLIKGSKSQTFFVEKKDIVLPKRPYNAHKYSCGKVFILAGSLGLTGAAAMCSESALRSGAGAVILGIPESLNIAMESKLTEVMTIPLLETSEMTLNLKGLNIILDYIKWADVVLIGPGISQNKDTKKLITNLIPKIDKPLVLDADGLNNLQDEIEIFKKAKNEIIITPHYGELSRLTKIQASEIARNRISIARKFAKDWNVTIVLKGAPTVIGDKKERVFINSTGNSGMATAGSGDVLSGIIAGLFAQTSNPLESSVAGVYLHGLAGDFAKKQLGEESLMAMDIQKNISNAFLSFLDAN